MTDEATEKRKLAEARKARRRKRRRVLTPPKDRMLRDYDKRAPAGRR